MNYFNIYKISFYLLILTIKLFESNNNIYRIPFGLYNTNFNNNSLDLINNIFFNLIYVNLSIGTPPQIIPFSLNVNTQTFSAPNNLFNKNKSSSYESISKHEISYEYEAVTDGFNSKDILNIDNITNKKINFILGTKYENKNNILGIIGLLIPKRVQFGVYPFFQSLRNAGFINAYSWTLKYFDNISLIDAIVYNENKSNIIGEFIIGDEPHNYETEKDKYNVTDYYKVSPSPSPSGSIYWDIEFNSIYLINKETNNEEKKIIIQGNKKVQLIPEIGFIIGPTEFFNSIKNIFFQKHIEDNICKINKIKNYFYNYIECEYNNIQFKVSSFPKICFEHIGFETKFNLTYKDLFIVDKINNRYIFLIFNRDHFSDWVLGTIFFRKFQLVFNEDFKTIGFYKSFNYLYDNYNNKKDNKMIQENKNEIIKYIFLVILLVIFSFLLIIFGMYFQRKCFNKNRKIRANELEENFSYESKLNNDKNNNINKDKSIINNEENKYHSI